MNRARRRLSERAGAKLMHGGWTPWQEIPWSDLVAHGAPRSVTRAWRNNYFIVQCVPEAGGVTRLMVRRNDAQPIRAWLDLQRVKNELCGPERYAVEVYPPQSQLVDDANLYHLWVFPEGGGLSFTLR